MLHLNRKPQHKASLEGLIRILEILIGFSILGVAFLLIYDRNFFFWPPEWAPLFNSTWVAVIGSVSGIFTLANGLFNFHSNWLFAVVFAINAAFYGLMTVAQWLPVVFIGYHAWHISSVLSIILLALVFVVAYFHQPTR